MDKKYTLNKSTDGIDVSMIPKVKGSKFASIDFCVYDFGGPLYFTSVLICYTDYYSIGQEVFYPTHQFFMSSKAIYFVVFDLRDPQNSRIEYWFASFFDFSSNFI